MSRKLLVPLLVCAHLSTACTPGDAVVYTSGSTTYEGDGDSWVAIVNYITIGVLVVGALTVAVWAVSEASVDRRDVERALAGAPSRFTSDLAAGLALPSRELPRLQALLRHHRPRLRAALCPPGVTTWSASSAPIAPVEAPRCTLDRVGLTHFWREVLDALASESWLGDRIGPLRARLAQLEAGWSLGAPTPDTK